MKLTVVTAEYKTEEGHTNYVTRWVPSQAAAAAARRVLMDQYKVKRADLDTAVVDLPGGKEGLLEVLNKFTSATDVGADLDKYRVKL